MTPMRAKTLGFLPAGTGTAAPFDEIFKHAQNVVTRGTDGVDALVLWGGTDIHPSLYNQPAHRYNQQCSSQYPIARDGVEWKALKWAKANNIPVIGVCRGAQMLCAFAGGTLVQHVENHNNGNHQLFCADGVERTTNSVHHQMMFPYNIEHELLGWSVGESLSYEDGHGNCDEQMRIHEYKEPEIVYFPAINGLAIQGHPEWMPKNGDFVQYCLSLVESRLMD